MTSDLLLVTGATDGIASTCLADQITLPRFPPPPLSENFLFLTDDAHCLIVSFLADSDRKEIDGLRCRPITLPRKTIS